MAHILVMEDRRTLREMLVTALEDWGYTADAAGNGAEGLRLYQVRPADLVVCDMFMPEKDGLSTIRDLRRVTPALPIIAISGGHQDLTPPESYLNLAMRFGADEVLVKPFPLEVLHEAIRRLLSKGSAAG